MPSVTRDQIQIRVFSLLARFKDITPDMVNESHPLAAYMPSNSYSRLLFGGHIEGIFPSIKQTAFTNSLFSASLDSVKEVIDYIKKAYPDGRLYLEANTIASLEDIAVEFARMQEEIKALI